MSLEPLLAAPWHIQLHAAAAMSAFVLGCVQFLAPKGTLPHRTIGPIWVVLMAIVTITAVFIVHPRPEGAPITAHFTFIHYIFIPLTTSGLIYGLFRIAQGGKSLKRHGKTFAGLFAGGLIIAGLFSFIPGRIMHDVVFNKRLSGSSEFYVAPYLYFLPGAKPPEREIGREPASEETEKGAPKDSDASRS